MFGMKNVFMSLGKLVQENQGIFLIFTPNSLISILLTSKGLTLDCLEYLQSKQKENVPRILTIRINCSECQTLAWLLAVIMEKIIKKIKQQLSKENSTIIESPVVIDYCKKVPKTLSIFQFVNFLSKMKSFRVAIVIGYFFIFRFWIIWSNFIPLMRIHFIYSIIYLKLRILMQFVF
jgi:hypothetical protein